MVYALRGKDIKLDDILNDFKQDQTGEATYVPQLARHLLENGLPTNLLISSSKIVSPAWRGLAKNELIARLKTWLTLHHDNFYHLNNLHFLFYLQEGGDLDVVSYNVDTLKTALDKGSTLIVCIDEDWVWGHRIKRTIDEVVVDDEAGVLEGHFVVVTGYEGNKFHVLDPFPTHIKGRHGAYDIDEYQFLNASLSWDPQIIEVLG